MIDKTEIDISCMYINNLLIKRDNIFFSVVVNVGIGDVVVILRNVNLYNAQSFSFYASL